MSDEYNYEPYEYTVMPKEEEPSGYYQYQQEPEEPQEPEKPVKKKKSGFKRFLGVVVLAIVFGLVASGVFLGSVKILGDFMGIQLGKQDGVIVDNTQIVTGTGEKTESDIADVVDNVIPSMVAITNMSVQEVQNFFFGTQEYKSESRGSGIIIGQNSKELLIVTNHHVIKDSRELTVTFIDDTSVAAQIKGSDAKRDLAILSVPTSELSSETKNAISIATIGNSDKLRVGETTIVIGNALGYGLSVTTGIVSALDRTLKDYEGELIQTDAAINQGNSGGALLNAKGEVIGINSAKLYGDTVESMGYAIPISDVTDILNDLMNRETKTKVPEHKRGSLGIYGTTVDENYAEIYNMPQGVFVSQIIEGSGAEKAGLEINCIITALDGTTIETMEELVSTLEYYEVGEVVTLTIQIPGRGGYVEEKLEVTLYKAQ